MNKNVIIKTEKINKIVIKTEKIKQKCNKKMLSVKCEFNSVKKAALKHLEDPPSPTGSPPISWSIHSDTN